MFFFSAAPAKTAIIYIFFFFFSVTPKVPKLDLVFAISALPSDNNFGVILDVVKEITERFFSDRVQNGLIVFGKDASIKIPFTDKFTDPKELEKYIGSIVKNNGEPALDKALVLAKTLFESESARKDAQKVYLIFVFSFHNNYKICSTLVTQRGLTNIICQRRVFSAYLFPCYSAKMSSS